MDNNQNSTQTAARNANRERAQFLLQSICMLRKPNIMEKIQTMVDGSKLLQTLVNTEHIERHLAQNTTFNQPLVKEKEVEEVEDTL